MREPRFHPEIQYVVGAFTGGDDETRIAEGISVTATYDGKSQTRQVKVGQRPRTEYFRWASKPGVDFPARG